MRRSMCVRVPLVPRIREALKLDAPKMGMDAPLSTSERTFSGKVAPVGFYCGPDVFPSRYRKLALQPTPSELKEIPTLDREVIAREQPQDARLLKVCLLGSVNTGKSLLFNRLLGERISPSSSFPGATRNWITGHWTRDRTQIVIVDTPPVRKFRNLGGNVPQSQLSMTPWMTLSDADIAVLVVDGSACVGGKCRDDDLLHWTLKKLRGMRKPTALVINKIDLLENQQPLVDLSDRLKEVYRNFDQTFLVSALKEHGLDELRTFLRQRACVTQHGWLYLREQTVVASTIDRIRWIFMEKLMHASTHKEIYYWLPKHVEISVPSYTTLPNNGGVRIDVVIHCNKEDQMISLRNPAVLNAIRTKAAVEVSSLLAHTCYVFLHVRQ